MYLIERKKRNLNGVRVLVTDLQVAMDSDNKMCKIPIVEIAECLIVLHVTLQEIIVYNYKV